jgi:hypothetical protein
MEEQFRPIINPFSTPANENNVAPIGRLLYLPGLVKVKALGVSLWHPLVTADVTLSGALWAYKRDIKEFLEDGPRKFLEDVGPSEVLREAANKVSFGAVELESTASTKIFSISGETTGNIFILDAVLGKYPSQTLVRGELSIRFEAIEV